MGMRMRSLWILLLSAALVGCGPSDNNGSSTNGTNGSTTNNTAIAAECATDDDCPAASNATFANADNVICTDSTFRGAYCSECEIDSQCPDNHACRNATYCEELPPCDTGIDCGLSADDQVHLACISGACDRCIDDADCAMDEICYSAKCATRTEVDPTCIDASCEGLCEIETDSDGVPTGVACVQ